MKIGDYIMTKIAGKQLFLGKVKISIQITIETVDQTGSNGMPTNKVHIF